METEGRLDSEVSEGKQIRRSISGNPYFSNEILDVRNGEVANGDIEEHIKMLMLKDQLRQKKKSMDVNKYGYL